MAKTNSSGLIQVYTGDGKGKTTAALGLAIRAAGQGMKVIFIQFLKDQACGEISFVSRYPGFNLVPMSKGESLCRSRDDLRREIQKMLSYAEEQMLSSQYNLLVLDEIFIAIHQRLISTQQVLDLLDRKPDPVELILTGRYAPREIIQRANLVTEMRMIKHPYQEGILARAGIEY
jgi:cob(I)alamin adenosyltransferase